MAQSKDTNKAQHSNTTVGLLAPEVVWWRRRSTLILAVVVVVVSVAAGVWFLTRPPKADTTAENAEIKTLQTTLSSDLDSGEASNTSNIINVTTQLINGVKAKNFTISNSQLAMSYLDRATAYLNQNQYAQAVADSESATSVDSSDKLPAYQIEFEARYQIGDRQQLIPMLQQIVQLLESGGKPGNRDNLLQYQQDIQSIQQNQEINFS